MTSSCDSVGQIQIHIRSVQRSEFIVIRQMAPGLKSAIVDRVVEFVV